MSITPILPIIDVSAVPGTGAIERTGAATIPIMISKRTERPK